MSPEVETTLTLLLARELPRQIAGVETRGFTLLGAAPTDRKQFEKRLKLKRRYPRTLEQPPRIRILWMMIGFIKDDVLLL